MKGTKFENSPGSYRRNTAANVQLRGQRHGHKEAPWKIVAHTNTLGGTPTKKKGGPGATGERQKVLDKAD